MSSMFPECDECKRVAIYHSRDLQELKPQNGFRVYEPASEWRHGCVEHPPKPSMKYEYIENA